MRRVPRPEVLPPGWRPWLRAAARRPGRGLLVTLGLVVTALVTVAALVAADSLERLFVADARAQWGTTDVLVTQPGEALIGESFARYVGGEAGEGTAGSAGRLVLPAVAEAGGRREPDTRLLGVNVEEQVMGPPLTGEGQVDVPLLAPEEVVVNRRLAERLGLALGDRLDLVIAAPELVEELPGGGEKVQDPAARPWSPTVAGIADDTGVADLGRTPNVLARLDTVQRVAALPGQVTALYVRAPAPGRDAADDVLEAFEQVSRDVGVVAVAVKEDALDAAEEEGGLFRGILLTLALLVVAAATAVTANLVALLGQERAREVAVLRALGVRGHDVRRLLTAEAGAYALVAAALGTALAVPLGGALAARLADHFASISAGRGREQVDLALTARPVTLALGLLLVLAVALTTAWLAARRVAALPVDAVLRGSPAVLGPVGDPQRRLLLVAGAGLLLLGMGVTASSGGDLLRFAGLSLLLVTVWLRRRRRDGLPGSTADPRLDTRAALLGLGWCLAAPAVLGDFGQGVQSSFGLLTLAGAGAVGCATVLVTARLDRAMRLVRLYVGGRRSQAALRTAGSYAVASRARAATVVGTVAGVLFMASALSVLGAATAVPVERQRGGYDVVGTAVAPLDERRLAATPGSARHVALRATTLAESWYRTQDDDGDDHRTVPYPVRAVQATGGLALAQGYGIVDALPAYRTSTELLDAVVAGRGAVVDRYARPEGAQVGDDVVIDDGRGPRTFELLGVLDTFVLQAVLLGPREYDQLFRSTGPTFLLATADGVPPAQAAAALTTEHADRGLVARTVAEVADEVTATNRTFTDVFVLVLDLGLAVALVAVAVLLARALRERRAALAVLRAVGFRRRDVLRTLLAEPLLQAAAGCVVGVGVGLGVLRLLFARGFADLPFVVDLARLGGTLLAVLVLVVVCCLVPAWRAARHDPAGALRDLG